MTITPHLDSLVEGGTNDRRQRIRLADGHSLALKARPGADTAYEVFVFPGLAVPDTEAWANRDPWAGWLTGDASAEGVLYADVPFDAVRDLIVQHGGEHEEREAGDDTQEAPGETAEAAAIRALATWGITAHRDDDAGNTWLVIGCDQSHRDSSCMYAGPYAVLYLYAGPDDEDEATVSRAPKSDDTWHVLVGDGGGAERTLLTCPPDQLGECVDAVAEWITTPLASSAALAHLPAADRTAS
jgi:hypothetical protein